MKKWILLTVIMLQAWVAIAQDVFFNDTQRKVLKQHLVDHKDAAFPDSYDYDNLFIRNLLTKKLVESHHNESVIGIYGFVGFGTHNKMHVLLKYHSNTTIISMTQDGLDRPYTDILVELIEYFKSNKDIDIRLFPEYNKIILNVFVDNTKKNEKGYWYNWHNGDRSKFIQD